MRAVGLLLLVMAGGAVAQAPSFQPVGSMSELMIRIIYPTSDALFYIERDPPTTDVQWNAIRTQALMLAESGNLMLLPNRQRDQGDWIKETKVMIDLAATAYRAALAKDMNGILAVNDKLADSCIVCHQQYRANYPKRPQQAPPQK
jgi:cytochrome c556